MSLPKNIQEFTNTELEKLKKTDYENSLIQLEKIISTIWGADAPRIIKDFTDHGMNHCQRLRDFAFRILYANIGQSLSPAELYLLLAGIYLHDIGMQCDVVRFPEIKQKAEEMGAVFSIEFKSKSSSNFSIEEQKAIRKNHQYLSAAWIDYAIKTGKSGLGTAVKSIPNHLISDLLDVIKYHSKLPITDCPATFRLNPNERKQLIAAILRFTDELDIESNRVNIETVKNFNIDPAHEVYWWIHNVTDIHFIADNAILINLRLSHEDKIKLESILYTEFIAQFQSKNRPVIKILNLHSIPIVISADSGIVEYEYAEKIPDQIKQALQKTENSTNPLSKLSREITVWLHAIRYEVNEQVSNNDHIIELIATLDQGSIKQKVLIHCKGGEITNTDVNNLSAKLSIKVPAGWLISDQRVSNEARLIAAESEGIQVFCLSEFLRQKIWGPYFTHLEALVKNSNIHTLYSDIGCYKLHPHEEGREKYTSLDAYIDSWVKERGKMHISILGEFGSGKTWFCRHYAFRQLQKYLDNPAAERLPLLITLRSFAKSMNAEQLINDALLGQYNLPFVGSAFDIFQEMNKQGKLLLILDGFDEMAKQVDYQTVVDNFWELAKLTDENAKVILTSRTEYFRWAKESQKILHGEEYGRRTIVLSPPRFEVIYLQPFTEEQIKNVILKRLGSESGKSVAEKILQNSNLAEMAQKPILVELLIAALDEKSEELLQNQSQVYLYATNKLLLRNIDSQRTFTSTADKLFFLCELAWEMIKSNDLRIHYKDIPNRIKDCFGERIKDQHELDTWDFDLRAQTLLHRNAAGYYEFAHKSLAEYFVALKFGVELGCLGDEYMTTYCEEDSKQCQMIIKEKNAEDLKETFGLIGFTEIRMRAIRDFLVEMVEKKYEEKLWNNIYSTKGKTTQEVNHLGGNVATILNLNDISFKGKDLAKTNLLTAYLVGCDLTETNLKECDLSYANLYYAKLNKLFFQSTHLSNTLLICYMKINLNNESLDGAFSRIVSYINGHLFNIHVNSLIEVSSNKNKSFCHLGLNITIQLSEKNKIKWEEIKDEIENSLDIKVIGFYADEIKNLIKFPTNKKLEDDLFPNMK